MRTKIVATIGPATQDLDKVHALAEIGVDVVRLNFAHGTHEAHGRVIQHVRDASAAVGKPLAVLADLAGPKIRIGSLLNPIRLTEHDTVVLAPEEIATGSEIPTTYPALADDVEPGNRVLLDDGLMELRVLEVEPPRVTCRVMRGGLLKDHKGMNLPGVRVSAPALTEKDIVDLEFALSQDVDYIGLSFVQSADDLRRLRDLIPNGTLIVAKIEKDTALENIESILSLTDAVMVARGDLGVELPFEQVPIAQKRIIQLANLHGRPVITATQMLESMIENPRPTRAEASDVANALFDGTDAVMLSGETAAGKYPFLAVEAMVRIGGEIERTSAFEEGPKYDVPMLHRLRLGATPTEHAIAAATVEAVRLLGAPAVVTFTTTGSTTRLVSSYRPPVPILGVTDQIKTWRQLSLVWGVEPVMCTTEVKYESMLEAAREHLLSTKLAKPGQRVVVTAGIPFHVRGTTNMLRIEEL
ncbi:MAG TPA: pyruvate kinase [Longimicrobiales bacterium]|nr:pyruvate kinase [Longimicrobiales bacterium]